MQPELDKLAFTIVDGLLKDLSDAFPNRTESLAHIGADLYGWKVARAEALADRLKALIGTGEAALILERMHKAADKRLRDEFAMQAPREIPDWFVHVPPPDHPGPAPTAKVPSLDEESEEFKALPYADQWARRHVHSEAVNAAFKENEPHWATWHEKHVRWHAADAIARFFQWRWHYADQMLLARNPEPKPDATVEATK